MNSFLSVLRVLAQALAALALAFVVIPAYLFTFVPSFSHGGGIGYAIFLSLPTAAVLAIGIDLLQSRLTRSGYWAPLWFVLLASVAVPLLLLFLLRTLMGL